MEAFCPICSIRISDWKEAGGETLHFGKIVVHKTCMIEFQWKTGRNVSGSRGPGRAAV